jgi:hypothetical protein
MSLKQLERDMAGCSRCSNCKWIPHGQIKSWRFAYGCPSISKYNFHAYSGGGKMIIGLSSLLRAVAQITFLHNFIRKKKIAVCTNIFFVKYAKDVFDIQK